MIAIIIVSTPEENDKVQPMLFKAGWKWTYKQPQQRTAVLSRETARVLILNEDMSIEYLDDNGFSASWGGIDVRGLDQLPIYIGSTLTQEQVYMLTRATKPIEVKEFTMEQLNSLMRSNFGHEVKITE